MRLLVCGGRDWNDQARTDAALDRAHAHRPITLMIHGAQATRDKATDRIWGADWQADVWATARGIPQRRFYANWYVGGVLDKGAGPRRNQQMIDEGRPDGCVAFPGGRGTRDMMRRAEAAGLPVWRPY